MTARKKKTKKHEAEQRIETKIVHGAHADYPTMDLVPPLHLTSTHKFRDSAHAAAVFGGEEESYVYARVGNPTVRLLEEKMAALEGGEDAIATASGMAAVSMTALALLKPGENFISCNSIYGGTFKLFSEFSRKWDVEARFLAPKDCRHVDAVEELIGEKTRFLFIETPANPTLDIISIALWAFVAREHNLPLVVDNTFASPYLQNPLRHGDNIIVVHSTTKYLNGHGDNIGGVIVGNKTDISRIREYVHYFGPCMSPFNAWLILRGMKTLHLRMERHSDSAMKIAKWLEKYHRIERVHYPGLKSHPGHRLAKKQMKKFGGMIAFEVKGGLKAGKRVMDGVKLCALAVSLGDAETLIEHPASMTHATYSREDRLKAGIADGLVRLSVGLEHADDIIADLEQAFKRV